MANVVRFVLDSARNLHVPGAGQFSDGVLDVDANNLAAVKRVRYLVQPYRAVELGVVASTTPPPALPAAPADVTPTPDPYPQYPTLDEIVASSVVRSAFVALWKPTEVVTAGAFRLAPDGTIIQRNANGTTRSSYDGTEAALWTVKTGAGGGTSYTDEQVRDVIGAALRGGGGLTVTLDDAGDLLTIGLPDGSVTPAKLSFDPATQAELDAISAPVARLQAAADFTGTLRGAWAGNIAYSVGDVVTTEAGVFRTREAHTSNAAGFRYDRDKWEALTLPALAGGTSVPVRQIDTTNIGTGLTGTPRAGIFQRPPRLFNYQAERTLFSWKAPADGTVSGANVAAAAGSAPGGSVVLTRSSGTATAVWVSTLATPVDLSGNVHIRVPARVASSASSMYLTFFLSSTGSTFTNSLKVDVIAADPAAYGWRTYSIPLSEMTTVGTGATLSAINGFRMEMTGAAGDVVELSRVTYHPNVASKAQVCLWLDDGNLTNQAAAIDIAARYSIPVTLAAIASRYAEAGSTTTTDKARYIQDILGGQVAVHAFGTADHDRPQDGTALLEQMLDYQHFGMATGLHGTEDLAYYNTGFPGPFSAEQEGVARKLFRSARATGARYPETLPPGDPYRTRAFMPAASATFAGYYQPLINRTIAYKGLLQLVWHSMNATDLTEFTTLCAWLDANRATVSTVTPKRAFDPLCDGGALTPTAADVDLYTFGA